MLRYKIIKILSNNVVLVSGEKSDYVLVGKGIGFGKKKGNYLEDEKNIEQKFISIKGLDNNDYDRFFMKINPNIIEIIPTLINIVEEEIGENLSSNINVGLIDHINFAIKRIREGIEIINPFMFETKALYPEEYSAAEKMVNFLNEKLDINIPKDEIGFLTFYIYCGRTEKSKQEALHYSKMMSEIIDFLNKRINIELKKDSFDYRRFIMHLRGVKDRVLYDETLKNSLLNKIKIEYPLEFKVAFEISKIMEQYLKKKVPLDEVGFITMHIYKIITRKKVT
ncbi:BglG family transcription antiterminator [Oceanirhabdus seepicola]|uniref:PRD domain-containing protein n=1 Tax=Oceanirhabdus seepicola TaxID=2828781 RepID=A0A9J6P4G5_9CLOT|nr:PRD domain-containing protein [Oceanirhabdus seepicola]MCM1991030.1 PRD domain-containing protein [Oceanirhabdus seepicola]